MFFKNLLSAAVLAALLTFANPASATCISGSCPTTTTTNPGVVFGITGRAIGSHSGDVASGALGAGGIGQYSAGSLTRGGSTAGVSGDITASGGCPTGCAGINRSAWAGFTADQMSRGSASALNRGTGAVSNSAASIGGIDVEGGVALRVQGRRR